MGGIVSLNSANYNFIKQGVDVKQEFGSFGLFNSYLGIALGKKALKSLTSFIYHKSDNDFKYENIAVLPIQEMTQHNAEFERMSLKEEVLFKKGANELTLHFWQNSAFRKIPTLMTNVFSSKHEETQGDKSTRIIASWSYKHNCFRSFIKQGFSYSDLNYNLNQFSGNNLVTYISSQSKEKQYYTILGSRYCLTDNIKINATINYSIQNAKIFEEKYAHGYNINQNVIDGMANIELSPYNWLNVSVLSRYVILAAVKPITPKPSDILALKHITYFLTNC